MRAYVLRRIAVAVPTLLGLSLLVFGLAHLSPGDPAEEVARRRSTTGEASAEEIARVRTELGLDRPLPVQYASWVAGAATGDLGISYNRSRPVAGQIVERLPATAELAAAALVFAVAFSVPFGVLAALYHRRWPDGGLRFAALAGASVPSFFLAYLLIGLFATRLGWFPVAGRDGVESLVLPAVALSLGPTAIVSRLLRSSLLEVLAEDYIRTGVGKGLSRRQAVIGHGLRNAAIPVVTVLGTVFGHLLTGAVIVEFIFAWPGLGRLTLEAVVQRDYPLIQGVILLAGVVFVLLNILVDLLYPLIDPRIRLGERV